MKKVYLLALSICFIIGNGIVVCGNEINSIETGKTLQKEQIAKLADYYLTEFFSIDENDLGALSESVSSKLVKEKENLSDSEVSSIIDLYSVDETVVAYFIPANKGYMIFDAKENGYGLLETVNSEECLIDILKKAQNKRLYYIFPTRIFSKEELDQYIEDSSISMEQIRIQQNMTPDDYEMSTREYVETLDNLNILNRGYEEVKIESNQQKFLPMWDWDADKEEWIERYGGKQGWFNKEEDRKRGCGTVAAANIFAYMAMNDSSCRQLYSYPSINKSNFVAHMHKVLSYVKPGLLGIPTLSFLERKMRNYASSQAGINLVGIYPNSDKIDSLSDYIKSGLRKNVPVAYLQYFNPYYHGYNTHWMTITKYFRNTSQGSRYIVTSTWGERHTFNLQALIQGSLMNKKGLVYFLKR